MAGMFEPVTLGWNGKTYTIQARKVLEAIAIVEEVITFQELAVYAKRGGVPIARLAMAYAKVLEYAGCRVSVEDVYAGMFEEATATNVGISVNVLLMMMIPPKIREAMDSGAQVPAPVLAKGEKEPDPGNQTAPLGGAS